MFQPSSLPEHSLEAFYGALESELRAYWDKAWFTNLANTAAGLSFHLRELNWVGFYLAQDGELVLGPFQGQPACLRIPFGRGVCGTSAKEMRSLIVDDVDAFPGHIACDSRSRSELVIPLLQQTADGPRVLGVLDLDSPSLARFSASDQEGLEKIAKALVAQTSWPERFY